MLQSVVIPPKAAHVASVIFMHGLGDSGHGWSQIGRMASSVMPNVKFIFPHAPTKAITVNGGFKMPAWYDITSMDKINAKEDEIGIKDSMSQSCF